MPKNDIYDISSRIKNLIAKEDIALSPVGNILVNYYALAMKDLYDFSATLPAQYRDVLDKLLAQKEDVPMKVIKVSTPAEQDYRTLYEEVSEFDLVEDALKYYTKEYQKLGGDDFWMEAEQTSMLTYEQRKIMRTARAIQMCEYLLEKDDE